MEESPDQIVRNMASMSPEPAAGIRRTDVDQGSVSMAIGASLSGSL